MKEFIKKNVIGVALGTFLSIQVVPSASLAVYQTLMTPFTNFDLIEGLEARIAAQDRHILHLTREIDRLHDRLINAEKNP